MTSTGARTGQNVDTYTGDYDELVFTVKNKAGSLVDCTGGSCTLTIRDAPGGAALATKTVGSGITISTSTITVVIASADTQYLRGDRDYYLELEISLSSLPKTAATGRYRLRKSISGAGA